MSNINVLVIGLNWSGSGTVVGLLREYQDAVQVPGNLDQAAPAGYRKLGEFDDFRRPGYVNDAISTPNTTDLRYLEEYIKARARNVLFRTAMRVRSEPRQSLRHLRSARSILRINSALRDLIGQFAEESNGEDRQRLAQDWIDRVVALTGGPEVRLAIFDQPINLGQDDDIWREVFAPAKVIVVYRDPRDQLAEMDRHGYLAMALSGDLGYLYGWNRDGCVNFRAESGLRRMQAVENCESQLGAEEILFVCFEELVTAYEYQRSRIEAFLGLSSHMHTRPKLYFDPKWSSRNIGVFQDQLSQADTRRLEPLLEWYRRRRTLDS